MSQQIKQVRLELRSRHSRSRKILLSPLLMQMSKINNILLIQVAVALTPTMVRDRRHLDNRVPPTVHSTEIALTYQSHQTIDRVAEIVNVDALIATNGPRVVVVDNVPFHQIILTIWEIPRI